MYIQKYNKHRFHRFGNVYRVRFCQMSKKIFLRALTDIIVKHVIKSNLKDPTDCGIYRPIAITISTSKMIEKNT